MKVELYRVYEVVVRNEEGNQVRSEMIYQCTKKDAVEKAQEILEEELAKAQEEEPEEISVH